MKWGTIVTFLMVGGMLYFFDNPLWACIFLGLVAGFIYWVLMASRDLTSS